jgi:PAS domain-containing protein
MKKSPDPPADTAELRHRAEQRLKCQRPKGPGHRTALETGRFVHELEVHQIELEMQNEELQRAHAKADALLVQYTDLYDFAPTGYFNLARDGTILAVNLTGARFLGLERAQLVNRRFGFLLSAADRPAFNAFLEKTFAGKDREFYEVALLSRTFSPMEPPRRDEGSTAKPQPNGAKRLECVELAPAFEPPRALRQRQEAGRTPNASRGSSSAETLAAGEQPRLLQCGETSGPGAPLFVRLEAVVSEGGRECRAAVLDVTDRHRAEAERERLIQELQAALARVKLLSGLLPICANCKKVRDDQGYWKQVESYIESHSEATFSHGICPECLHQLYPGLEQRVLERTVQKERQRAE